MIKNIIICKIKKKTLLFHPHLCFLPRFHCARRGEAAERAGACVFTGPFEGVGSVGWVQHAKAPAGSNENLNVTRSTDFFTAASSLPCQWLRKAYGVEMNHSGVGVLRSLGIGVTIASTRIVGFLQVKVAVGQEAAAEEWDTRCLEFLVQVGNTERQTEKILISDQI